MTLPDNITLLQHAGHACLQLRTRHGTAILALHGAHLLSWVPAGQREVFWLSPLALPEPAAIRGGVPVCWPWFAKQGAPLHGAQHGPVRGLPWQISGIHSSSDDAIRVSLVPVAQAAPSTQTPALADLLSRFQVSLTLTLSNTLQQTLHTRNQSDQPFVLTQALHSYFAVGDAHQVGIEGLVGMAYSDSLRDGAPAVQHTPFALDQACDRIYHHGSQTTPAPAVRHRYTLVDPIWQRRIHIDTEGSQSVVVWNPGQARASQMADVPNDGWPRFFCIEAANAGPDTITLAPGGEHQLRQTLSTAPL
jgi:glucose-6-phosphate 1-epimerase